METKILRGFSSGKQEEIKELDKEKIESIEVKKPEKKDDKTTIRIKTK